MKLIDNTLFLSFLSLFAYFICYNYESGYLSHFSVPEDFIIVDLEKFFSIVFKLIAVFIILCFILGLFFLLFPSNNRTNTSRALLLPAACLSGLVMSFIYSKATLYKAFSSELLGILMLPLIAITLFIIPYFKYNHLASRNRYKKYLKFYNSIFDLKKEYIIKIYIILTMFVMLYAANIIGYVDAAYKTGFLVYEIKGETYVMARRYGENIIFSSIDSKTRLIGEKILVRNINTFSEAILPRVYISQKLSTPISSE